MTSLAERLQHLAEVVDLEIQHLQATDQLLFQQAFDVPRVLALASNQPESERVDAFVARFGRLQDTTGDKLLPALLRFTGQAAAPVIDNLHLAEKWGWLPSAAAWLEMRQMRNRMVHEYLREPALLCDALNAAHQRVPVLVATAQQLVQEAHSRLQAAQRPTSR